MPSNYPDSFDNFTNPGPADSMQVVSHSSQHSNENDAIEAIEQVLGLNPEGSEASVRARLEAIETALDNIGSGGVFDDYKSNDLDESGSTIYVGQSKPDSESWLIQRMVDTSGDLDMQYANISNNPGSTTYAHAWTNRLTLTYENIGELTF